MKKFKSSTGNAENRKHSCNQHTTTRSRSGYISKLDYQCWGHAWCQMVPNLGLKSCSLIQQINCSWGSSHNRIYHDRGHVIQINATVDDWLNIFDTAHYGWHPVAGSCWLGRWTADWLNLELKRESGYSHCAETPVFESCLDEPGNNHASRLSK